MKLLMLLAFTSVFFTGHAPGIDKTEAQNAFRYLNKIRIKPQDHVSAFTFLKNNKSMPALQWNDTLARVAEAKVVDMVKRNYFAHVDPDGYGLNYFINKAGYNLPGSWTSAKEMNYFESLSAGANNGEGAIANLLIDAGVPSLGHRKHLLGLDKWNETMTDIGIGFYRLPEGSAYKTYVCIIIARHNW